MRGRPQGFDQTSDGGSKRIRLASVDSFIRAIWPNREAMGLDNRGKWRLLSGMTDIFIPHEIRPFEAKDSSKAPLVQRINSKYVRFVDCPAFRCVQHDGEDICVV